MISVKFRWILRNYHEEVKGGKREGGKEKKLIFTNEIQTDNFYLPDSERDHSQQNGTNSAPISRNLRTSTSSSRGRRPSLEDMKGEKKSVLLLLMLCGGGVVVFTFSLSIISLIFFS